MVRGDHRPDTSVFAANAGAVTGDFLFLPGGVGLLRSARLPKNPGVAGKAFPEHRLRRVAALRQGAKGGAGMFLFSFARYVTVTLQARTALECLLDRG